MLLYFRFKDRITGHKRQTAEVPSDPEPVDDEALPDKLSDVSHSAFQFQFQFPDGGSSSGEAKGEPWGPLAVGARMPPTPLMGGVGHDTVLVHVVGLTADVDSWAHGGRGGGGTIRGTAGPEEGVACSWGGAHGAHGHHRRRLGG